jgi:hypothetical protein
VMRKQPHSLTRGLAEAPPIVMLDGGARRAQGDILEE